MADGKAAKRGDVQIVSFILQVPEEGYFENFLGIETGAQLSSAFANNRKKLGSYENRTLDFMFKEGAYRGNSKKNTLDAEFYTAEIYIDGKNLKNICHNKYKDFYKLREDDKTNVYKAELYSAMHSRDKVIHMGTPAKASEPIVVVPEVRHEGVFARFANWVRELFGGGEAKKREDYNAVCQEKEDKCWTAAKENLQTKRRELYEIVNERVKEKSEKRAAETERRPTGEKIWKDSDAYSPVDSHLHEKDILKEDYGGGGRTHPLYRDVKKVFTSDGKEVKDEVITVEDRKSFSDNRLSRSLEKSGILNEDYAPLDNEIAQMVPESEEIKEEKQEADLNQPEREPIEFNTTEEDWEADLEDRSKRETIEFNTTGEDWEADLEDDQPKKEPVDVNELGKDREAEKEDVDNAQELDNTQEKTKAPASKGMG